MSTDTRRVLLGIGAIVVIAASVALVVALYTQLLTSSIQITVHSRRAGLLTEAGAAVRLHGAKIGKVAGVTSTGGGAILALDLDPRYIAEVPPDVAVRIEATTVFGSKAVHLVPPARPANGHIEQGAVISDSRVSTEINTAFENLDEVVTAVRPTELNATLGSLASALHENGHTLGDLLVRSDSYLAQLNPKLPNLGADIQGVAQMAELYDSVAPEMLAFLRNTALTTRTVVDKRPMLDATLHNAERASEHANSFLLALGPSIRSSMGNLAPVTDLLHGYSPELTCMFRGVNHLRKIVEPIAGGDQPGLRLVVSLLPGQERYQYPRDLPVNRATDGPDCRGLPVVDSKTMPTPRVNINDGTHIYQGHTDALTPDALGVQLFGAGGARLIGGR